MLRDKGLILLFLLVLALLLVPFVHGEDEPGSHARIVRLSYVEGQVQVAHRQGGGYENATVNVPLVEGDQVRTGNDGWVEIQFENGSNIRLAPESQITFSLLTRFPSGATGTEVNLDDGEGEFAVAAGDDDGPFRVNVRQRVISLKHSSRFRVTTMNPNPLEVAVWKGEVGIFSSASGQEVPVKKHEIFTLDPMDAAHYDLEKDARADELDEWSTQRDQYLQSYSASNNTNYTQSPYQYGVSDLNYYGQYYNVVGCGYCWQPYGVGLGWDPFMNGYWGYSSFGPAWISAYPWGWMPYRFGQWVFVPGFGWLWQPGLWNRWVPVPRVVNPPAGFRAPVPPATVATGSPGNPGAVTKFDGGPARLTVNNPALSTTSDKSNRPVISNEHTPVQRMGDAGAATKPDGGPAALTVNNPALSTTNDKGRPVISNEHTPVQRMGDGGNFVAPASPSSPSTRTGPPPLRVHPPVVMRPMAPIQQPISPPRVGVVNTPPPTVHVSPPPVSRPQTFSPPPRSFSPPPASAPAAHSGGPHR